MDLRFNLFSHPKHYCFIVGKLLEDGAWEVEGIGEYGRIVFEELDPI
jgi:hypothetical protein